MSTSFQAERKLPAASSSMRETVVLGGKAQQRRVEYDLAAKAYFVQVGKNRLQVEPGSDNAWHTTGQTLA